MNWTACEAQGGRKGSIGQPARHRETVSEPPERHQGGRKEPFGQPGRHQGPFGQPERHQGGRKGMIGQLARQERIHWTACEAPGRQERTIWQLARHQGGRKGSIGQPARHQGSRKKPFGQTGRHQGGTRETCSAGLSIEFRFWKGAGFGLTFNISSMANGPARSKSWGGRHGRLPSTD